MASEGGNAKPKPPAKDLINFAAHVALPAVTGFGSKWLVEKQRMLTRDVGGDTHSLTAEQRAYRGLLAGRSSRLAVASEDGDAMPGKGGSLALSVVCQADYLPKSARVTKRLCGGGAADEDVDDTAEEAAMRKVFASANPDADGNVTQAALVAVLPARMRAALTDEAFAALDTDGDGNFSYEEVTLLLARLHDEKDIKQMRVLFDHIDKDHSGEITAKELQHVLPYVTDSQVELLIEEFDTNHDGMFTFEEVSGMFPRLKELGADSLPIPYCQALVWPIEALKSTSMEMAQYFLGLRFMAIMFCVMMIFGLVLCVCNVVINDTLMKQMHVYDQNETHSLGPLGETEGTSKAMTELAYTSTFPSVFLASFSYKTFWEKERYFPDISSTDWNLLVSAEIIHTGTTVAILCFLVWALGTLNDQIVGSEELLDKGVTSCSDFTMEVQSIPPSATAVQLAALFRRWGKVAKVVLHFPTKSILVKHTIKMSTAVTNLRFVERKDRLTNDAESATGSKKVRRSSIAAVTEGSNLTTVNTVEEAASVMDNLAKAADEIENGKPKCLTNPPTPFATAFISFVHEADREECEKSFASMARINWVHVFGCGARHQQEQRAGANAFLHDQRWQRFVGQLPPHWSAEWSTYFVERMKGPCGSCCRTADRNSEVFDVVSNAAGRVEALEAVGVGTVHTRCSTLRYACDVRWKTAFGCGLHLNRAPEPTDILWANLHVATCSKILRYAILVTVLTLFCIAVSALSAVYILVSGFGEKMKTNDDVKAFFSVFSDDFNAFLFSIAPITISQANLITKLLATKALVPALAKYIRHRSESQYTASVLVCTFAVETMQTAFLIAAAFVLATMSSRPYSDGDLPGESGLPKALIDVQTGNDVMQALGYLLFITCINGAISLMLMDSPGMLPVWIGRSLTVLFPKVIACCKCTGFLSSKFPVPQQHELDAKWRAPSSPIHIWTSKLAAALVAVCAIGPWYPLIYFGAAFQVTSMLLCELWALLKLHSAPDPRGFEVAHISATIYQGCIAVAFISALYYNYIMFGATKGDLEVKHWVPVCLTAAIWVVAAVFTPLVTRIIPRLACFIVKNRDGVEGGGGASAAGVAEAEGEDAGPGPGAGGRPSMKSPITRRLSSDTILSDLLGADPDREKTWGVVESELLMITDSMRLNAAGVIQTRGAHHPLKLDLKEAKSRPDLHAYAPYSVLLPKGAVQVGHSTTAEQESAVDDGGFVVDLVGIQVWELGIRPVDPSLWQTIPPPVDVNPMHKARAEGKQAPPEGGQGKSIDSVHHAGEMDAAVPPTPPTSTSVSSLVAAAPAVSASAAGSQETPPSQAHAKELAAANGTLGTVHALTGDADGWYYDDTEGTARHGPFTLEQLHEWVHDGHFTLEDIVYEGFDGPHITLGVAFEHHDTAVPKLYMVHAEDDSGATTVGPYRGADLIHWHGEGEMHPQSLVMEVDENNEPVTGEWVELHTLE